MTHGFARRGRLYQANLNPGPEETSRLDAFLIVLVIAGFREGGIPGAEVCVWKGSRNILIRYSHRQTLYYQTTGSPALGRKLEYIYWYIPGDRSLNNQKLDVHNGEPSWAHASFREQQFSSYSFPVSSLAEALVWTGKTNEQCRSPTRSIGPLPRGRAGADTTPPQLFTNRGCRWIDVALQESFLLFAPSLNISRNNYPQVAFSPHATNRRTGSRLHKQIRQLLDLQREDWTRGLVCTTKESMRLFELSLCYHNHTWYYVSWRCTYVLLGTYDENLKGEKKKGNSDGSIRWKSVPWSSSKIILTEFIYRRAIESNRGSMHK